MEYSFAINLSPFLNEAYNKVTVHPNPAEFYTTFTYELQPDVKSSILQISDVKGTVILYTPLSGNIGHYLWDTRKAPSGVYVYAIFSNGKKLNDGKIVVKK